MSVPEMKNAVFSVTIDKSNVKGEWLRDGKVLSKNDRIKFKEVDGVHTLTLVEVMKSEGGSITFKCSNAESTCVLTVSDAEVALTRPLLQEITANENQIAELECEINRA